MSDKFKFPLENTDPLAFPDSSTYPNGKEFDPAKEEDQKDSYLYMWNRDKWTSALKLSSVSETDARFVLVSGDAMTGPLVNAILDGSGVVQNYDATLGQVFEGPHFLADPTNNQLPPPPGTQIILVKSQVMIDNPWVGYRLSIANNAISYPDFGQTTITQTWKKISIFYQEIGGNVIPPSPADWVTAETIKNPDGSNYTDSELLLTEDLLGYYIRSEQVLTDAATGTSVTDTVDTQIIINKPRS